MQRPVPPFPCSAPCLRPVQRPVYSRLNVHVRLRLRVRRARDETLSRLAVAVAAWCALAVMNYPF